MALPDITVGLNLVCIADAYVEKNLPFRLTCTQNASLLNSNSNSTDVHNRLPH